MLASVHDAARRARDELANLRQIASRLDGTRQRSSEQEIPAPPNAATPPEIPAPPNAATPNAATPPATPMAPRDNTLLDLPRAASPAAELNVPRAALATEPKVPMAPASEPALLQASPAPSDPPPATAPAAVNVEDERFASLRRSYMERLAAMGQAFRELPSRLQQDDMLSYLRLSDGSDEEVRQRAFAIFSETLESAQEHTVSQLQQRLAARDAQVVQLLAERSMGTEALETARKRLAELEHYEHVAGHWQQRCRPLRDRCVELEEELVSLRDQRATERVALELATQIARDAEQQVMATTADCHQVRLVAIRCQGVPLIAVNCC